MSSFRVGRKQKNAPTHVFAETKGYRTYPCHIEKFCGHRLVFADSEAPLFSFAEFEQAHMQREEFSTDRARTNSGRANLCTWLGHLQIFFLGKGFETRELSRGKESSSWRIHCGPSHSERISTGEDVGRMHRDCCILWDCTGDESKAD
jgi:hypothetical protein